jgi:nucleotide-binding universal stress UspA family protein
LNKLFNHILVPVNFNRDTKLAAEKAIALANQFSCDVYFLHAEDTFLPFTISRGWHITGTAVKQKAAGNKKTMEELVEQYRNKLNDGLFMYGEVHSGRWFDVMKHCIITRHIDLVIIPKSSTGFWKILNSRIDINGLARQTNCPVLIVTNHFDIIHLKNIVVPVNDFLPIRKLTAATYIARRFNAIIHLMGYKKSFHEKDGGDTRWLTKAYQLLRDHTQLKIHRSSSYGHSVAGNTLSYAKLVEADLIVINTGNESVIGGWLSRKTGKYLYKESNIAVLTIAPPR